MTRQRRWQLKKLKAGLCQICSAPRLPNSKVFCLRHLKQGRARNRAQNGTRPWRPGSRGPMPLEKRLLTAESD